MRDLLDRECHCVICADSGILSRWRRPAARERHNARLVREYGWGVTGVLGTTMPDWAYTIGLWHSYASVEVCLLGVPQQPAMEIVNAVGRLVRDGETLTPERKLAGVMDGVDLSLAPVHDSWYDRLFGAAIDYYQRPPFPVVQLLWPEGAGDFAAQPSLWVPFDEHPRGVWTEPLPA